MKILEKILDGLVLKQFEAEINYNLVDIFKENTSNAKADILKWVREQLPKKKYYDKETTNNYAQYAFQGYNQAIDETEKKFK